MLKRILLRAALFLGTLAVSAVLLELGFRAVYPDRGRAAAAIVKMQDLLVKGDTNFLFVGHPFVSHVRNPASDPRVNSLGFLGPEWRREKPAGVIRVACLGGSTTQSYPAELQALLDRFLPGRFQVLNFGMSSWTTAETLVNFCLNVIDYTPDVVVIHHAVNDLPPRLYPGYRSDYSHWRTPFQVRIGPLTRFLGRYSQLYLYLVWLTGMREFDVEACMSKPPPSHYALDPGGELLPETAYAYERNIHTMVELARAIGAVPILVTMPFHPGARHGLHARAILDHNRRLRALAAALGVELVDLARHLENRPDIFIDVVHFKQRSLWLKVCFIAEAVWRVTRPGAAKPPPGHPPAGSPGRGG